MLNAIYQRAINSSKSSSPKEIDQSLILDHQAQLFFSVRSIKGLKVEEPVKLYCLASLEKQTIQTTSTTIYPNTAIEWNEGYTFDVSSPTSVLSLSFWQTNVNLDNSNMNIHDNNNNNNNNNIINNNNNHGYQNRGDQSMSISPINHMIMIDDSSWSASPRKHVNMFQTGKLVGKITIPYSIFQTTIINEWFPLQGNPSCSAYLKLSYTNSNVNISKVTLDDFVVLRMIGKGGFGHVNLVQKVDTQRLYAMKVVKKEKCLDLNAVQHTFTERKLLKKYYHPFIVGLKYSFQTQDSLCMVLDYIGGGELFYHINERETFSEDTARFYISQIMLAIGFLHEHKVIYRDLKLENLLMDLDGNLCLVDFGLCKEGAKDGIPTYTMCGSPEYMAPETITGSGYGKSVDWWALGTLFYEMIVGLPPFYSEDPHEMTKLILAAPLKFPNNISKNASSLISMLLNRDPSRRLGSGESDVEEIKSHPFFRSVNWTKVLNKEIDPPFKPHLNGPLDLTYFDPICTIHSLPINPNTINTNLSESDQMAFKGFSYSAPDIFLQGGISNTVPSSPSVSRSSSISHQSPYTPNTSTGSQQRLSANSPIPMVLSQSPVYSGNGSISMMSSSPMSPPSQVPINKQSWVQPQFPHLHHPIPQKPLFTKLQERRRSASVNAQTQFSLALGPDEDD